MRPLMKFSFRPLLALGLLSLVTCTGDVRDPLGPDLLDSAGYPQFNLSGLVGTGSNFVLISQWGSNLCITAKNGGTTSGTEAVLAACNGASAQRFDWLSSGQLKQGQLCLSPKGTKTGDPILLSTCNTSAQQIWEPSSRNEIIGIKGLCIDFPEKGAGAGTPLRLRRCADSLNQKWTHSDLIVAAVSVQPSSVSVVEGSTQQLSAVATDANGVELAFATFSWGSSDPSVATVSQTGLATGVGAGTVTITATAADREGSSNVQVLPAIGDLEVSAVTTGSKLDPDGFSVVVSGGYQKDLPINGVVTFEGLAIGTYTIELLDVASDCMVIGADTRAANVLAGETVNVTFDVTCGSAGPAAADLIVRMLDVGRGDAIYIENGTSRIIIDGGDTATRYRALLDSLNIKDTTIDAVILTHGHKDHAAGLVEAFRTTRKLNIDYFFSNDDLSTNTSVNTVRDSARARAARGELVYRNTDDPCGDGSAICTINLAGGAKLHVMRPQPNGSNVDNRSAFVKLVGPDSASFSMLFTSGAEQSALNWFETGAGYHINPGARVDLVQGFDHGNCTAITQRFATLTSPTWALFSLAAGDGRVHNQLKQLLTERGISWYRTDLNGSVTIVAPASGGYTITPNGGTASMNDSTDVTSTSSRCKPIK